MQSWEGLQVGMGWRGLKGGCVTALRERWTCPNELGFPINTTGALQVLLASRWAGCDSSCLCLTANGVKQCKLPRDMQLLQLHLLAHPEGFLGNSQGLVQGFCAQTNPTAGVGSPWTAGMQSQGCGNRVHRVSLQCQPEVGCFSNKSFHGLQC